MKIKEIINKLKETRHDNYKRINGDNQIQLFSRNGILETLSHTDEIDILNLLSLKISLNELDSFIRNEIKEENNVSKKVINKSLIQLYIKMEDVYNIEKINEIIPINIEHIENVSIVYTSTVYERLLDSIEEYYINIIGGIKDDCKNNESDNKDVDNNDNISEDSSIINQDITSNINNSSDINDVRKDSDESEEQHVNIVEDKEEIVEDNIEVNVEGNTEEDIIENKEEIVEDTNDGEIEGDIKDIIEDNDMIKNKEEIEDEKMYNILDNDDFVKDVVDHIYKSSLVSINNRRIFEGLDVYRLISKVKLDTIDSSRVSPVLIETIKNSLIDVPTVYDLDLYKVEIINKKTTESYDIYVLTKDSNFIKLHRGESIINSELVENKQDVLYKLYCKGLKSDRLYNLYNN